MFRQSVKRELIDYLGFITLGIMGFVVVVILFSFFNFCCYLIKN